MNIPKLLRYLLILLLIGTSSWFIIDKLPNISWSMVDVMLSVLIVLSFFLALLFLGIVIVPDYEQYAIFRSGQCVGVRGPGITYVIPLLEHSIPVDLRVKHAEVTHESCITRDNIQLDVDLVFYWKIENPIWSITKIINPEKSIVLLATALLRAVIAHFRFDDILNQRESLNDILKEKINEISSDWGVGVTTIEIREIRPPNEIIQSMHKQVSAEWQRKATVIEAEGAAQAQKLRAIGEAEAQAEVRRLLKEMEWESNPENKKSSSENPARTRNDIFIVHGHDDLVKESVSRFIEKLGLNPVILHEKPNKGMSIIEKFENNSNVSFAIVLLTPDDLGASREDVSKPRLRARQNVIFELGYFIAKLGRRRVCALYKEGVEIPSDYQGVLYIPVDKAGAWQIQLAQELKAGGLNINLNKILD